MRARATQTRRARRTREGRGRSFARGVLMLEVMVALALIVVVGLVVLAAVSQSTGALRDAREKQVAVDLARSAMARLEAGVDSTTTLSGPVKAWMEDVNLAEVSDNADETAWELVVETEPSTFDGLTYVSITARKTLARDDGAAGGGSNAYTLRQLVRLAEKQEDGIGDKDDVMIEAERGIQRLPDDRENER